MFQKKGCQFRKTNLKIQEKLNEELYKKSK